MFKVTAYPTAAKPDIMKPAGSKRDWMDAASAKNPYRCLPLSMANSWGWEVLSSAKFTATWDGGMSPQSVKIIMHGGHNPPSSHFGEGTLTWHTGFIFKTPYPIGLYVTGAPNWPKPNVIPLSGVVETHWLTYTFTMNWRFTQPGTFTMDVGEPYCQIFPIDMNMFDNVVPEIRSMSEDKEFYDLYWDWNISRANYMTERRIPGSPVSAPSTWQRHYFQGRYPPGKVHSDGAKCPFHINTEGKEESVHRTKPNVPEFKDLQTEPFKTTSDYKERTDAINIKYKDYLESIKKKQEELDESRRRAIQNAPTIGPRIDRSPEEVEVRMQYYEQLLRKEAKRVDALRKKKITTKMTIEVKNGTAKRSNSRSTTRSTGTNSSKQRTTKRTKSKTVSTN